MIPRLWTCTPAYEHEILLDGAWSWHEIKVIPIARKLISFPFPFQEKDILCCECGLNSEYPLTTAIKLALGSESSTKQLLIGTQYHCFIFIVFIFILNLYLWQTVSIYSMDAKCPSKIVYFLNELISRNILSKRWFLDMSKKVKMVVLRGNPHQKKKWNHDSCTYRITHGKDFMI